MKQPLKLQFEASLDYQSRAVDSVVDLFEGQPTQQSLFTVTSWNEKGGQGFMFTETGIGNRLELSHQQVLENLQKVQLWNDLPQSSSLNELDFDIEMETGTGKTYVYIKSMLELNRQYGFTKFIIVVPSIAIKEGVYKSLEITRDHFASLYDNQPYDFFVYDSSNLNQVRSFATADHLSIIIINIDAFRRAFTDPEKETKANIIHRPNEKLQGMKPIQLIQETNPIVIIDEPQSVDTTPKSREAIKSLNPLMIFRYSATHVQKHQLLYRLDAVDAFNMELVKGIEVTNFAAQDEHNQAYLRLVSAKNTGGRITARLEMDKRVKGKVGRTILTISHGQDLYTASGGLDAYEGMLVEEINCTPGQEYILVQGLHEPLRLGVPVGDVDQDLIKSQQIEETIRQHLDKSLQLRDLGIKVLSLFFIDRVANYREYPEGNPPRKGKYARIFEEHFKKLAKRPKYASLFEGRDIDELATRVHDGYFSEDKRGFKDTSGITAADETTYAKIMREKERMLSFGEDLSFIFSHSALREGWDNPNVFQICTLNETSSEVKKRQEIGRGLRLCVNQEGQRQYNPSINILTVMANESYEEFCQKLQKEYEEEGGIRFGVIEPHTFASISWTEENDKTVALGGEASREVFDHFVRMGYIMQDGSVKKKLRQAVEANLVELPDAVSHVKDAIIQRCKKAIQGLPVKKSNDKRVVALNKERYLHPDFKAIWDKIKYKTTYRVKFDSQQLIDDCVQRLQYELTVPSITVKKTTADIKVHEGGVEAQNAFNANVDVVEYDGPLPDVVAALQNSTNLTRRSIVDILVKSGTLRLFKKNPQRYIEEAQRLITFVMRGMMVDGIKYTKIDPDAFYAQELFETEELVGYLEQNMVESHKSIYEYVVYDSVGVEKTFALKMEANPQVRVYAKLPDWFKISTPLGNYNPDWAVVLDDNGRDRLYFVVETKGSTNLADLRGTEGDKIRCGKEHFAALGTDVRFDVARDFDEFVEKVGVQAGEL
ncbi:MAG: type III restriction-modification system endonuclease [Christensenellales bacterium]|jgi:type III restriction enzyme